VHPDAIDGPAGPVLRRDAELNRVRIVTAAREVFAEQGLDVSMTEVARRAGVGIATLYRRFPTREDLITGVFAEKMQAYLDAVDEALSDPDPWKGFCGYIQRVCAMQAADRGFTHVLTATFPTAPAFEARRAEAFGKFAELVARAKAVGRLRADFETQDLAVLLMANAGVLMAAGDAADAAWPRLVAYALQSFSAQHAGPLPPPPAESALYRAMIRIGRNAGSGH
jgi:AcrR family transcriptional regulator